MIEGVLQQKLSLSSETDLVVGVAILNQTLNLLTHERLIKGIIIVTSREGGVTE